MAAVRDPRILIAKLGTKLTLRGFPVSPDDTRKAFDVLSRLPSDVDPETVGRVLAGVYARDEKMYEQFMDIWYSLMGKKKEEEKRRSGFGGEVQTMEDVMARDVASRVVQRMEQEGLAPISSDVIVRWKYA